MSEIMDQVDKWIARNYAGTTDATHKAKQIIPALREEYLKFFNLHHTLAVQEAGIKGILCDALKIAHYEHTLYELSQTVTEKLIEFETLKTASQELCDSFKSATPPGEWAHVFATFPALQQFIEIIGVPAE